MRIEGKGVLGKRNFPRSGEQRPSVSDIVFLRAKRLRKQEVPVWYEEVLRPAGRMHRVFELALRTEEFLK